MTMIAPNSCCIFLKNNCLIVLVFLLLMLLSLSNSYVIKNDHQIKIINSNSTLQNDSSNHLHNHRKHLHHNKPNRHNIDEEEKKVDTKEIRYNKKRCRYSDHEIELMNKKNALQKMNKIKHPNSGSSNNNLYDDESVASLNALNFRSSNFNHQYNHVKQPKVRDQFNNRHHFNNEMHAEHEHEKIYADIGDTINMTCYFDTEEVDWHFKDKNLTTTVLAYGLELQVSKQILLSDQLSKYDEYDTNTNFNQQQQIKYVYKYKVGSDRLSTHLLTLYVQGSQDEGIYQCIDSKSENPIKKTISLVLKNNSRALTSGLAKNKSSNLLLYLSIFLITSIINYANSN